MTSGLTANSSFQKWGKVLLYLCSWGQIRSFDQELQLVCYQYYFVCIFSHLVSFPFDLALLLLPVVLREENK